MSVVLKCVPDYLTLWQQALDLHDEFHGFRTQHHNDRETLVGKCEELLGLLQPIYLRLRTADPMIRSLAEEESLKAEQAARKDLHEQRRFVINSLLAILAIVVAIIIGSCQWLVATNPQTQSPPSATEGIAIPKSPH